MSNGGIFINYRRCDGNGSPRDHALFVEILSHELAEHFGDSNVFIDTSECITNGYPDKLPAKLAECDVLLVVIHPGWLTDLQEASGDPADSKFDRVHQEIRAVLNGNVHSRGRPERHPEVIPVLLEKADPPKSSELPEDIRELALLQAFRLRFGSLTNDLTRLFAELEIHTSPSWPLSPAPDPQTPSSRLERTGRNMPGRLASRSLAAAAFALGVVAFAPYKENQQTGQWEWDWNSPPHFLFWPNLLVWSTVTIMAILLITAATTGFGRSLHRMESRLHSQSAEWLLIARLGLFFIAAILLQPLVAKIENEFFIILPVSLVVIIGALLALASVFAVTIKDVRADSEWPPRISIRPRELRRAIARLEHRLTSSWRPPLSRMQRDQAWLIASKIDDILTTLRETADRSRTRRGWLRTCGLHLAVGYTIWIAVTLGVFVTSLYEISHTESNFDQFLRIPFGVASFVLGVGTVELFFRHDRRAQHWFIEEIENDRENRLTRHMSAYQKDRA